MAKRPIVVVDDDEDNRDAVAELLAMEGYAVRVAESGQAAIDLLHRETEPCLLLLDQLMPGLSGQDVIAELERLGIRERVTVVLLSGLPRDLLPSDVPTLRKPFDLDALLRVAREHCGT